MNEWINKVCHIHIINYLFGKGNGLSTMQEESVPRERKQSSKTTYYVISALWHNETGKARTVTLGAEGE